MPKTANIIAKSDSELDKLAYLILNAHYDAVSSRPQNIFTKLKSSDEFLGLLKIFAHNYHVLVKSGKLPEYAFVDEDISATRSAFEKAAINLDIDMARIGFYQEGEKGELIINE